MMGAFGVFVFAGMVTLAIVACWVIFYEGE